MNDNFKQKLKKTNDYISLIFNQFEVWKSLNRKEYRDFYQKNLYFWNAVLSSLKTKPLLNLAKLFEEEKHYNLLSVYNLLKEIPDSDSKKEIEKEIQKYQKTIDNLKGRRNKMEAHFELEYVLNPNKVQEEFPLKYEEIEDLLGLLEKIMGMIEGVEEDNSVQYSYDIIQRESKLHTELLIKTLKEKYKDQKKEKRQSYETNEFYTTQEVAEMLKVNVMTIYRYIKSKKISAHKIGGEFRIRKKDFESFLDQTKNN